jgi:hypothetical protein
VLRLLLGFAGFWYAFIVGDAWEIAAGVVATVGIAAALLATQTVAPGLVPWLVGVGASLVLTGSLLIEVCHRHRPKP